MCVKKCGNCEYFTNDSGEIIAGTTEKVGLCVRKKEVRETTNYTLKIVKVGQTNPVDAIFGSCMRVRDNWKACSKWRPKGDDMAGCYAEYLEKIGCPKEYTDKLRKLETGE